MLSFYFSWPWNARLHLARAATLALSCALISNPAQAQAGPGLSMAQAVQLALAQSRRLEAANWHISAAREMAQAAAQRPDPVIRFGINNMPVNGAERFSLNRDFMTMRTLGVAQEWTRDAKLQARSARYEKEAEALDSQRLESRTHIRRDAALAWLACSFQERLLALQLRQRDEARMQIEAAELAYRNGRGPQNDVLAAHIALAHAGDQIARATLRLATSKTRLARWIGSAAESSLAPAPAFGSLPFYVDQLDVHLQNHPQLDFMRKQEAMAQADLTLARANLQADWSVELMWSQRGPAYANMLSVNVSVPLQWDQARRQNRELAAKMASVAQIRAERDDATLAHAAEIRAMLQEWQSGRERLLHYDERILPLARARIAAASASYRGGVTGSATLGEALAARRSSIELEMERLQLEWDNARLWVELAYLLPPETTAATATVQP